MKTAKLFIVACLFCSGLIAQNGTVEATNGVIVGESIGNAIDGTIQYDGTDFVGLKQGDWESMTETYLDYSSSTNLNNTAYNLDFNNGWVPIGPSFNLTKAKDHTAIELDLTTRISIAQISSGFGCQFELRIDGLSGNHTSYGSILTGDLNETVTMKSVFENLAAGTYTYQVYARAPNFGSTATGVILDPGGWGSRIIAKEF